MVRHYDKRNQFTLMLEPQILKFFKKCYAVRVAAEDRLAVEYIPRDEMQCSGKVFIGPFLCHERFKSGGEPPFLTVILPNFSQE